MAYVLRHNPTRYGLQPDRHGYVDIERFLAVAGERHGGITLSHVRGLVEDRRGSERFELSDRGLRARYGHSIPVEPLGPPIEPPPRLYHGTEAACAGSILIDGLTPMSRRMVHLSGSVEDAVGVARRKIERPVVWCVRARDAASTGLAFYREGRLYLTTRVPARFLERLEPSAPPACAAHSTPLRAASRAEPKDAVGTADKQPPADEP